MPIRNQIIRVFHQQGRETISRSERIVQRQTTLKERIMAPAGPKGVFSVFTFLQMKVCHNTSNISMHLILFVFSVCCG